MRECGVRRVGDAVVGGEDVETRMSVNFFVAHKRRGGSGDGDEDDDGDGLPIKHRNQPKIYQREVREVRLPGRAERHMIAWLMTVFALSIERRWRGWGLDKRITIQCVRMV